MNTEKIEQLVVKLLGHAWLHRRKLIPAAALVALFLVVYTVLFAPLGAGGTERFVVARGMDQASILESLKNQGFIRSIFGLRFAQVLAGTRKNIKPGAYTLRKSFNVFAVAEALNKPAEVWIVVQEGLRKEEIAEVLAGALNWGKSEKQNFIDAHAVLSGDLVDGHYFPDTYLMPATEDGIGAAKRMVNRFNEKFAPYVPLFLRANVKNDTAVTLASLVQREAGGRSDMPLIAGILWNRLKEGIKLDVDATVQYARGEAKNGWWTRISPEDKEIDSPYNTYRYSGLPPSPIANPGIAAIDAVLNPKPTQCFYYLHADRQIYCAVTYDEHLDNIARYLR